MEQAGAWLRQQRQVRGWTQERLGSAIGESKSVIYTYESGISAVDDDRAAAIAKALHLDELDVRRNVGLWVPEERDGDRRQMTVDEFIAQDTTLSPEAKRHYRQQYELLRRIMPALPTASDEQLVKELRRRHGKQTADALRGYLEERSNEDTDEDTSQSGNDAACDDTAS